MGKEGASSFILGNQGKVNIAFFLSLVFLFVMMMLVVNAITITLVSPGDGTVNDTTDRNINFTFNVTWSENGEGISNCSIWSNVSATWQEVAFNTSQSDDADQTNNITNGTGSAGQATLSFINYTFATGGIFAWSVACYNESITNDVANYSFPSSGNFTLTLDAAAPVVNTSLNTSLATIAQMNEVVNFTANITDDVGLSFCQIIINQSGPTDLHFENISLAGTTGGCYNISAVTLSAGGIINYTIRVNDTTNRWTTTDTIMTVDDTMPGLNTTFNTTLVKIAQMNEVINITGNLTDNLGLLSANITHNMTNVNHDWVANFSFTGGTTNAEISNATTLVGSAGSVINFTMYVTDTSNNVKQNSTLITIDDTIPVVNSTFNITLPSVRINDILNITGNLTDNLGLLSANITHNMSGVLTKINFSFTGGTTSANIINVTRITTGVGSVINFTMYVTDTSNNVVQNSTKFTVADNTTPTLNVTLDLGSSQMGKRAINGTNTTDTTPTIAWNLTESIYDSANISYISVQVDSSTSNNCNKFRNFTTTVEPYVETQRNGTLTVKGPDDQVGCTGLSNGTHTARVTAVDTSGNSELYIHSFVVQTGEDMNVVLGLIRSPLDGVQAAVASVNHSNITPYHVLVFNATLDGGVSTLKNMTWVSSCNNTVNTYGNGTSVSPFNHSGCKGVEGNFSVNVTATDHAGNSVTGFFQFAVDDVAPTITVHSPADGVTASGLIELNVSAFDQMSRIDSIGYYLDGNPTLTNHTLNGTSGFLAIRQGENVTNVGASVNFTSGPHTIKFMINDSRGNVQNSSVITFIQTGPVNFDGVTNSIQNYVNSTATGFNITIRLKKDDSTYAAITATNETSGNFFEIQYDNGTTNISLVDINGSAANWGKINFTPYTNQTSFIAGLQNNWTNTILSSVWFNNSIEEFITLNNSYYGVVVLPFNISGNMSTVQEFWWIEDEDVLATRATTRNISACTGGFSATTTTPCWNYTSAGRTEIYVPHFSMVLAINDSSIPTVTLNSPASTQVVSGFIPNVTLSSDATSCKYILNITDSTKVNGQSANVSSSATAGIVGSNNICTWDEIRFKNGVYNITYNVSDAAGNLNLTSGVGLRTFTMNDGTAPATSGSISSTPGITSATVTVSANESVNVTITYGTNNGTKSTKDHETDFSASQTVTLSPLSASTLYYYNVSICDFNNNCMTNQTFSFTTNAAAAADDSSSSSSGGGGGGSSTVSTVTDSKAQVWSAVPAGSSFNLDVDKATIAVTSVSVSGVKSNLKNVELEAAALTENPLSTEAAAKVYQYLRINKKNIRDSDAESFKVGFRVTKSWLTENSLVSGDISLYRYKSGWNELVTRVTGTDSTYVNYEADTPGFSSFAIGTKSGVEVPEEVLEEEVAPGEVPEEVAPPEVVEKPKAVEAPSKAPIAWIIAAIVIILGIILIVVYQKQKKQV